MYSFIPLEPLDALKAIMSLMSSGHLGYARITIAEDEEPEIVGQSTIFTETPPEKRARSAGFINQPLVVPDFPDEQDLVNAHTEAWEDPVVEEPTEEIDRTPAPAARRLSTVDTSPTIEEIHQKGPPRWQIGHLKTRLTTVMYWRCSRS